MRLNRSGHNRGPRVEVGRHEDSSRGWEEGKGKERKKIWILGFVINTGSCDVRQ